MRSNIAAIASALVCLMCASMYAYSFFAVRVEKLFQSYIFLFAGAFLSIVAIYFLELPYTRRGRLSWEQLTRKMPAWARGLEVVLGVIWGAHFFWMLEQFGLGVPEIIDGEFVIESRGRVLSVISEAQYLSDRRVEIRFFSFMFMAMYFVLTMYWCYRKAPQTRASASD